VQSFLGSERPGEIVVLQPLVALIAGIPDPHYPPAAQLHRYDLSDPD
jgi:hypothetical protein